MRGYKDNKKEKVIRARKEDQKVDEKVESYAYFRQHGSSGAVESDP